MRYKQMKLVLLGILSIFSTSLYSVEWNGIEYDDRTVSELITIITSTNPIPSIPRTTVLYEAQKSLFLIPAFQKCKQIIVFDGIQPGFESRRDDYEKYKNAVRDLTQRDPYFQNAKLVFCDRWVHLAGGIREAMKHVTTPFVFIHQHDFIVKKQFDLNRLIATMAANPGIKHVRVTRGETNTSFLSDSPVTEEIEGVNFYPLFVPLCRTSGWSDNDHVARTDYYTEFVSPACDVGGLVAMEHVLHPALKISIAYFRERGYEPFGTYLYGNLSDGAYIEHMDGRNPYH